MRYETSVPLGQGGMGTVYRAFDPVLGRNVALKFLNRENPALVERLLREARLQARVDHEHVCRVYEVGESEGRPYIVMQYIDGQTLDRVAPTLSLEQKVRLMREVAEAVHAANRTGLVHRDLKPSNIMVEAREEGLHPFVLDFGLAREAQAEGLTETGQALGSPPYMAPEQARGDVHALDRRTDVYALGAVLYELLCGRPPFQGRSTVEILLQVMNADPPAPRHLQPRLPADLETVVLKCLEKEPPARYDSARALAEDLGRYLDGDPVRARPVGPAHRLLRKARKNPRALAAGAAVLVLTATLMVLWLRARGNASAQAEFAQRFGQEVERIESTLRQAYLLPLHDTRAEKQLVRERMKRIEADMVRLGAASFGPGSYALGRGYFALGEYDQAREHLQRAWARGYRGTETAQALGRTLGALYSRALDETQSLKDEPARQARRQEIGKSLRDPALAYLSAAETPAQAREYTQGLIAYYEARHEDALRHLERAYGEGPDPSEARLLAGQVRVALAKERTLKGDAAGALEALDQAGASYAEAAAIARSNPDILGGECERLAWIVETGLIYGKPQAEAFERALPACEAASRADPERAKPHVLRSRILWNWADYRRSQGRSNQDQIAGSIEAARQAVALDARDPETLSNLGLALWTRADEVVGTGDPRGDLREAAAAMEQAAALRPNWVKVFSNLCGVYHELADWEALHGLEAEPDLARAEDYGRRATELGGQSWQVYNNLGLVYWTRAQTQLLRGSDPSASVESARRTFARALELNPKGPYALRGLAGAEEMAARYELWRGGDPRPLLHRVRENAQRAVEAKPDYAKGFAALGLAEAMEAEYLLEHGGALGPSLAAGRKAFARALSINADATDAFLGTVRLEVAAAREAQGRRASPEAHFAAAARALNRLVVVAPSDPDTSVAAALLHRWRAEWRGATGPGAAGDIRDGLAAAERTLAVNPREAEAKSLAAALHLLQARHARDEPTRAREAAQARSLLQEAFGLNPLLRRSNQAVAQEAARLTSGVQAAAR